ncbi:hypothetical protein COOONC_28196 [Cooperia oncophora]
MVKIHEKTTPPTPLTAVRNPKTHVTPTKTNEWLRHLPMESQQSPPSSPRTSEDIASNAGDRISGSSDPRGSQLDGHGDPVEKHAPVKRKKFPLGASENERRSKDVVVVRF